jgi:hypothetical protein
MVLAHRGVDASVQTVASLARDPDFQIYGNWPRSIQAAYALGVPGHLTRFGSWADVERVLAAGQPIIASIIVDRPGDLRGAPYDTTAGHLIVLTGLTESGDVFVNDPAVADARAGQLVYRRADLSRVWLANTQGTAYILLPRTTVPLSHLTPPRCGLPDFAASAHDRCPRLQPGVSADEDPGPLGRRSHGYASRREPPYSTARSDHP